MESAGDPEDKGVVLPSTETDAPAFEEKSMPDEQWTAMKEVIDNVLGFREEDGHDPSKVFHKRVNKKNIPSYYEVIKEPMAFSNLKAGCSNREYTSFAAFVRDCALIWHNAYTYNRPDAGAYQDATTIKSTMEKELQKLVDKKIVDFETAAWPDLGEIPPVEDPAAEEDEDDEEEGDEDDEDEEADLSGEDASRKKRSRPSGLSRSDTLKSDGKGELLKKRRGRPPKVDTPMEARIKNVLKGLRKPKNSSGIMIHDFEKLPDKTVMPEYFLTVQKPISIEQIKKNQKRKRYNSLEHFMTDIDLMFANAKLFNEDDSQIYKNAVFLQQEAHRLAEIEKNRPDDEFVMEEGRKPRPGGITHKGQLWKVGDWVHIRNANDMTKPIIAQVYRTWEDASSAEWVNVCWYYRPEQTVHQYEKHFFPGEVVKTGQYRDHPIDDIIDRCFVMFCTRYGKGRPRGLTPTDMEVYVCEARYNEEKHKMNKIKTWASCLPDEVRDADYEMDMFEGPGRRVKKVPSPLLYLLKDDDKESDELPKPRWEAENAPPIVGGIYKGPRDENQSPPPEATPSPPPQPPPPAPRQVPPTPVQDTTSYGRASQLLEQAGRPFGTPPDMTTPSQPQQSSYPLQSRQYAQPVVSPAPVQYQQTQQHSQTPPTAAFNSYATPQHQQQPQPQIQAQQQQRHPQQHAYPAASTPYAPPLANGQRPPEVFVLPDHANVTIPEDVRDQFQKDDQGRIIFYSRPPLDILTPYKEGTAIGHSVKYKAAMIKRKLLQEMNKDSMAKEAAKKHNLEDEEKERSAKRQKQLLTADQERSIDECVAFELITGVPFDKWLKDFQDGTARIHRATWGNRYESEGTVYEAEKLKCFQEEGRRDFEAREARTARHMADEEERKRDLFRKPDVYLDDIDPRY